MTSEADFAVSPADRVGTILGPVPHEDLATWQLAASYFKPLSDLYLDPTISEIMVDRHDRVRVERNGVIEEMGNGFKSEKALATLIKTVAAGLGQPFDEENPILDARFPDGARLCCTHAAVTPSGCTITIRCKRESALTLDDLVSAGALTQEMAVFLVEQVKARATLLVSGGTSSGKTTVLRALAMHLEPGERVLTAEDTLELGLERFLPGVVALEAPRRRDQGGTGGHTVTLSGLVKTTLRMRPDRVWVGEIRDAPAASAFLEMCNTGHDGGASTIHATSPASAVRRIQYLLAAGGLLSYELAGHEVRDAVQLIVQAKRHPVWGRRVTQIALIQDHELVPVFDMDLESGKHRRLLGAGRRG